MFLDKEQRGPAILFLLLTGLLVAGGFYYNKHRLDNVPLQQIDGRAYQKLVTAKDRAPLPIPETAVKQGRTFKVPILMYHHVGDPPPKASVMRKNLTVSVAEFEAQAKWLAENDFTSIKLEDIYLYSLGQFQMPKKPVVFTFDDGYLDALTNALPILKKYNFIGSFAIITQYPKSVQGDNFYASWEDIAQAKAQGHEIVSHTQNHFDGGLNAPNLDTRYLGKHGLYSSDYIFSNLSGSRHDISDHLGFETNVLIYPYGHYTPDYINQAKKAGFVMGLTVHEGDIINLDNLMEIPRIRVSGSEDFEIFKRRLSK